MEAAACWRARRPRAIRRHRAARGAWTLALADPDRPKLPPPAELSPFGGLDEFGLGDLGFDAGGTAHCIEDGETGFVIPRLDVAGLSARLEELLRDPALGERMGRAALRYVKERYHPAALTAQMEEVFRRVIAGLPPVDPARG